MTSPSSCPNTPVNPDNGVCVEMEGIMEVRYTSDDPEYHHHLVATEDMFHFQYRVQYIPDGFCLKNKRTTEQAVFFCVVCNCELQSFVSLRDHVTGSKHIQKAFEKKRQVFGLLKDPANAPRPKEIKKKRPIIDVGKTLEELLRGCGEPAIGLEYITEFTNPSDKKDHPMYTCSLDGCKSAWGTSYDMFHHVKNYKHQRNLFKEIDPEFSRIMTKNLLLDKAVKLEENEIGDDHRDYNLIKKVEDYDQYMVLRYRPNDWSEKKEKIGLTGSSFNSNIMPLGNRKRKVYYNFERTFSNGITDLCQKMKNFKGEKGDDNYQEIAFYQDSYNQLLSLFTNDDMPKVDDWKCHLASLKNQLIDKVSK